MPLFVYMKEIGAACAVLTPAALLAMGNTDTAEPGVYGAEDDVVIVSASCTVSVCLVAVVHGYTFEG